MTEYIHAHATYRFVIMDEEEEKPRILVSDATLTPSPCCSHSNTGLAVQTSDAHRLLNSEAICHP